MAHKKLAHLTAWRAFDAVARNTSFQKAARELSVSPGAISQQVKLLEDYYGVRLFQRNGRSVSLTNDGMAVFPEISAGFDCLARATARLQANTAEGIVQVTAPPTFSVKWLAQRLGRFSVANPAIQVLIDSTERLVDLRREPADVAIRYGGGTWEGMRAEPLMDEWITPVCSPAYLTDCPINSAEDLAAARLIHDRAMQTTNLDYPDWDSWFAMQGMVAPASGALHFSSSLAAIQAAIDGHGVILGRSPMIAEELALGSLIAPLGPGIRSSQSYYILTADQQPIPFRVAVFIDWLRVEVATFRRSA
jgi:LysR family glycine cleavage system transcriptional activator